MKIVVCKKYRLIEQSGGKFKNNDMRKLMRSKVVISKLDFDTLNSSFETSGIIYEIDEDKTKELFSVEKLDRDALKNEADKMGLDYPKNIKTDALKELIETNK